MFNDDRSTNEANMATPAPLAGAPAPTPDPAIVPPSRDAAGTPTPMENTNLSPQPPKQPSMWRRVLAGALEGMTRAPELGAIRGAINPTHAKEVGDNNDAMAAAKVQEAKGLVKFRDAQAAAQVAAAQKSVAEFHNLPREQQDETDKISASVVTAYTKMWGNPTAVIDDDGPAAMQHMQDVTAGQGAVDHMMITRSGGKLYAWDTTRASGATDALGFIKSAGAALGLPMLENLTADAWKVAPPAVKLQYMQTANDVHGVTVPDPKNLIGQLKRLGSEQRTLQAKVAVDPTLQPLLDHVNSNLDLVNSAYAQTKKDAKDLLEDKGRFYGYWKNTDSLDENGNLVQEPAGVAWARGHAKGSQGARAMSQNKQLEDMHSAVTQMREVIGKMDGPFDADTIATITASLRGTRPGLVSEVLHAKLANQQLTASQEDFVTWIAQLTERSMALRSVAGIGQQGSDKLREAVVALLPTERDNPTLMTKKLNAFEQQLNILEKGIPGVGRNNRTLQSRGGDGANNTPKPTVNMSAPDGTIKPVPADQVEHYKSLGAKVVK